MARYLEGSTIAQLADGPIREGMAGLGELWHHADDGVFVEHRGTEACLQAVAQLRTMASAVPSTAPVALGGAPAGDPYTLPTQLAAMVLNEAGMRAVNLGPNTPAGAFAHAVRVHQPKLVWISISTPLAPARARSLSQWLATVSPATSIVVGGSQARTLSTVPARAVRATSMSELAAEAATIVGRQRAR